VRLNIPGELNKKSGEGKTNRGKMSDKIPIWRPPVRPAGKLTGELNVRICRKMSISDWIEQGVQTHCLFW
jgi:hypothetical protein